MNWLVVKRNCRRFSGTTLLKLACFVNTANNTSKYQSLSLISYPRDERLSKVCFSFSCIRLPLLQTELALQSHAFFIPFAYIMRRRSRRAFCGQNSSEIRRQKENYSTRLSNLVPRVSLLPAPATERERPWVNLVT